MHKVWYSIAISVKGKEINNAKGKGIDNLLYNYKLLENVMLPAKSYIIETTVPYIPAYSCSRVELLSSVVSKFSKSTMTKVL